MTTPNAPDTSQGESGALDSGSSDSEAAHAVAGTAPPSTAFFTRVWFWALILCCFWVVPLLKSLNVDYPDPVPGFDREPEVFSLLEEQGVRVSCAELGGHILVLQALNFESAERAEADFATFRKRKKRIRGLGSLVANLVLVQGAEPAQLSAFLEEKKARKPSNLFLYDDAGDVFAALRDSALAPQAEVIILDRHGRLRGAYGPSENEGNRMAQDLGSLANWLGSDPEIGQPVSK